MAVIDRVGIIIALKRGGEGSWGLIFLSYLKGGCRGGMARSLVTHYKPLQLDTITITKALQSKARALQSDTRSVTKALQLKAGALQNG